MSYVWTVIIAIVAWQLITTIVYFASGEKEDAAALTGMGLWALLLNGFGVIWRSIQLAHSRKYNCYQFYGDCKGTHSTYNGWIGNYFMTPKMAERFRVYTDEAPSYSIKLLRTGSQFKSVPPKCEIITEEKLRDGFPGMTKDFIAKFLKEEYNG